MAAQVVVDSAGAFMGGAARFLGELESYVERRNCPGLTIIGRGRGLSPTWLLERERQAPRSAQRIALNNVSFSRSGGTRIVILRNALHFAEPDELAALSYRPPKAMKIQTQVVRAAARRADVVVAPCAAMAERVLRYLPSVSGHIVVRPHPVTPRDWAGTPAPACDLLVPVLNAPYKRLPWHLKNILDAYDIAGLRGRIHVTAVRDEFPEEVGGDERLNFVGRLNQAALDRYWQDSRAIYFPTQLEAFGYPLAEARANGRRIIALDTPQNREIGGAALAPFATGNVESLAAAIREAMEVRVIPDLDKFDADPYFDWLLGDAHG